MFRQGSECAKGDAFGTSDENDKIDESRVAGGYTLAAAFLALVIALFVSAAVLSMGHGWRVALVAYVCVAIVVFLSFVGIFLFAEQEEGSINAFPSRRTSSPRKATSHHAAPQWSQKSPTERFDDGGRVFHIGSSNPNGLGIALAEAIASQGHYVDICDDLHAALSSIASSPLRWTLLIVDIDDCERHLDLPGIVDDLSDFRFEVPHVPVIALSSNFGRDDFGLHRLSIADISLRLPTNPSTIIGSLQIARSNNLVWVTRVNDVIHTFRAGDESDIATHPAARGVQ